MGRPRTRAGAAALVVVVVLSACTAEPPRHETAGSPGVTPVGGMAAARAAHTATRLPSGGVLVAGGFDADGRSEASAEVFDPATSSFTETAPMSVGRQSHTATLLDGGRVLIAGGYEPGGERLASAEIYDPSTGRFEATGSMSGPRADHTATLLSDGRVLIAGGTGPGYSFLSSAEVYDPVSGSFAPTGSLSVPRESATATLLRDGRVLVAGGDAGRHEDIRIYATAELYDPGSGSFAPTGDMTIERHKHDAVRLRDGRVLIVGGSDERDDLGLYDSAELYDPATRTFTAAGSLNEPRYKFRGTTVLLADGRVLVCCGAAGAETFDPAAGSFTLVPGSVGTGPLFAAAARVAPEALLVTGGYSSSGPATANAWLVHA